MSFCCTYSGVIIFVHPIVRIMSTPQQAVEGTTAYLTICFAGIPLITAYNIISSIFRGLGDSKSPMYFIAVACGVNIVLDYILLEDFILELQVQHLELR
nr:MATE family efflux transporter [Anaerostipes hadrus]